jgi:hypothetical protein
MSEEAFNKICDENRLGGSWQATFRVRYAMTMPNLQRMRYEALIHQMEAKTPREARSYQVWGRCLGKQISTMEAVYERLRKL